MRERLHRDELAVAGDVDVGVKEDHLTLSNYRLRATYYQNEPRTRRETHGSP
jgi:hypothetical protein